ncbi:glycosyltransferase [Paraburkholderia terrae]|uniref:glycosyltransferase n=1 Tax=Paraburkholderia terrae TaxID=311230 RepID=UPI0030E4BE9B
MHNVAIYRHQLFKRSEPFIEQQAMHVPGFRPIMIGRERWGSAPAGMASSAISDVTGHQAVMARTRHAITRHPEPVVELLRPFNVQLIHAHFGVDGVYAERVAACLDVPLVTTFHGFDVTTRLSSMLMSGKPSWANYLLHRRTLARNGELFVCVSNFIRDQVLAQGFPENRTRLHYIGVDTATITPPADRADRPIVLHVGRLVEKKGTDDLIQAFAMLPKRLGDARLIVVGEGPLRDTLIRRSETLGIAERVVFMGAQQHHEVLRLMRDAALLCQPSVTARSGDAEGLGMVLLEAAASGIPVVGTQSGGIPEAVVDGQTGYLVREHDIAGLSRCITDLLDSSSLRERMGHAARRHVEQNFNVVTQSTQLAELYQEVL